jgi:hypothetical protein
VTKGSWTASFRGQPGAREGGTVPRAEGAERSDVLAQHIGEVVGVEAAGVWRAQSSRPARRVP